MNVVHVVLNGVTIGAIYILLSAGLTLVFGLQGIVNVAHGVFYMLGAYLAVVLLPHIGFVLTLPVAFLAAALLGLAIEVVGLRPLIRWKRHSLQLLIFTLAVAIIASELTKIVWGPVPRLVQPPQMLSGAVTVGPLTYPAYWLFVIGFAGVLMAVIGFAFKKSTLGILVQSLALNSEASQAMGTNAKVINSGVFSLGAGIAGVAGVLAAPILSVYPTMCFDLLMILFVVIILGGLGSLLGTVVAGIAVGLMKSFGVAYLTGTAGEILAFAAMVAVLVFRPLGLFGRAGILK